MQIAPKPPDESKRLAALLKLRILDTPIEERFERITRMICRLLDVPISVFTLVDGERQWFKSVYGLSSSETSRDIAFCSHAILENGPMIVPDAHKDVRFADNPLVTGAPHIGFYAGYPVCSTDGYRIGTICVIDRRPRQLSPEQLQLLQDMAAMLETELRMIELSKTYRDILNKYDAEKRLSLIDPLTRLWNHAGAMDILQREWAESQRSGASIGLIMAEIDQFKRIYDNCGDAASNAVLQDVAKRILSTLRPTDAVTRFGNHSFLMILPGCMPDHLALISERPLKAVSKNLIATAKGEIPVTISIGAVAVPSGMGHAIDAAISTVEAALARAANANGNRVEIGQMPPGLL